MCFSTCFQHALHHNSNHTGCTATSNVLSGALARTPHTHTIASLQHPSELLGLHVGPLFLKWYTNVSAIFSFRANILCQTQPCLPVAPTSRLYRHFTFSCRQPHPDIWSGLTISRRGNLPKAFWYVQDVRSKQIVLFHMKCITLHHVSSLIPFLDIAHRHLMRTTPALFVEDPVTAVAATLSQYPSSRIPPCLGISSGITLGVLRTRKRPQRGPAILFSIRSGPCLDGKALCQQLQVS